MDLDALERVFCRTRPDPDPGPPTAADWPPDAPAALAPGNPTEAPPDSPDARQERAAGVSRETAGATADRGPTDPDAPGDQTTRPSWRGVTLATMRAAAGADWPEIADRPAALDALALLLRTRRERDRGDRPAHYTQPARCATCGPVWLWDGAPAHLLACPWCLTLPARATIPRPPINPVG